MHQICLFCIPPPVGSDFGVYLAIPYRAPILWPGATSFYSFIGKSSFFIVIILISMSTFEYSTNNNIITVFQDIIHEKHHANEQISLGFISLRLLAVWIAFNYTSDSSGPKICLKKILL